MFAVLPVPTAGGVLDCKRTAHGPAPSGSPNGLYVFTD
jgi:hypothetical protein